MNYEKTPAAQSEEKRFSEQTIKVCNYYYQYNFYWLSFFTPPPGKYDFIIKPEECRLELLTFYVLYKYQQIKDTKILEPVCLK